MIFITGATGLVGSFIAKRFLDGGFQVKALKRENSDLGILGEYARKIEWVDGDILDITFLEQSLKGVEIVIHAAAIVSFSPSRKSQMFTCNIEGTANIVNAALNCGVKRFIHISSVAALGRKKDVVDIDETAGWEDSDLNSNYATSKYLSELEVWRGFEEGLSGFVVNPSVVLGPGDWTKGSTALFQYVYKEKPFYTDGKMNYVDVRDVAESVFELQSGQVSNERFILNAGTVKYQELFGLMAQKFGKKPPHIKAGKVLREIAWRLESIKSFFTGKEPLVTKETSRISNLEIRFRNEKVCNETGFRFRQLDDTVSFTCAEIVKKYSSNK